MLLYVKAFSLVTPVEIARMGWGQAENLKVFVGEMHMSVYHIYTWMLSCVQIDKKWI